MIRITDSGACTGCGACRALCPREAITMRRDENGFFYPEVNLDLCAGCSLCERSCPVDAARAHPTPAAPRAYAVQNADTDTRERSSSGGVFALLASAVLDAGGVVFGAAFSVDHRAVRHIAVRQKSELFRLLGSKYVQSETGDAYRQTKNFLEEGTPVLFGGTPCQVAGLYAYLKKEYPQLTTYDVVCHGVPSPLLWEKYLAFREECAGAPARRVSFRDKKYGWRRYSLVIEFTNGKVYRKRHLLDPFMRAFLKNVTLRSSCFSCAFKGGKSGADLTLADFWGAENFASVPDDDSGTSLVLTHSEKGAELFSRVFPDARVREVNVAKALSHNGAFEHSADLPREREEFLSLAREKGVETAARRFFPVSFSEKCRSAALDTRVGTILRKRRQKRKR